MINDHSHNWLGVGSYDDDTSYHKSMKIFNWGRYFSYSLTDTNLE